MANIFRAPQQRAPRQDNVSRAPAPLLSLERLTEAMLSVSTPAVERLSIEAPVASEFECRQLFLFEQPVDGRGMDPQVFCNIVQCQDLRPFVRSDDLRGILYHSQALTNC
jgi:hypothetical protein